MRLFGAAIVAMVTLASGDHHVILQYGGLTRSYIVHIPRGLSGVAPVVISFHGVYATGMSNGAMMTYRIAAEAPDLVAAIAPVSGSMVVMRFSPTLPVPVMHIHSIDDPRALYAGGLGPPFPGTSTRNLHPPVEEQLAKWVAHDGCRSTPTVEKKLTGKSGSPDQGNTATKLVYAPCTTGANVVLWKLTGSGHVWPGSDAKFERLLGRATHVIDANEEMWSFFSSAPRRVVRAGAR